MIKLLDRVTLEKMIYRRVKARQATSFIRLGDGEFVIIKYPSHATLLEFKNRCRRWVGNRQMNLSFHLPKEMKRAFRGCDFIGVPSKREMLQYPKWKNFEKVVKSNKIRFNNPYHFYVINHMHGFFHNLVKEIGNLTCISCRYEIQEAMQNRYNIKVPFWKIPPEPWIFNKKQHEIRHAINNWKGDPHYPDLYYKYIERIRNTDLKGKLFFVGAGGFGKIYCDEIKRSGGMAFDVGSMFDAWAGYKTRPYILKGGDRYVLKD